MKNKTVLDISVRICFFVLVFFMLVIVIRFFTRQVCVEIMGWDNAFTKTVFLGDEGIVNKPKPVEKEGEETTVEVDWDKLYPFQGDNTQDEVINASSILSPFVKYKSLVSIIEHKIETYTGDLLFGHMLLTKAGKLYNSFIGCAEMPMNNSSDTCIFLNNGYMTYTVELMKDEEIKELADSVSDFSDWLTNQGIGFVYANAGSKIFESDKQLPAGETDYINENADELISMLNDKGVDVLDYRPLQKEKYVDWYSSYYMTDHHWKNTTALWAAGVLANHLNNNYGFGFDESYFSEDMYSIETTDNYFLGGQGRSLTSAVCGLEPFSKIKPIYETDLSIKIPTRGIDLNGSYEETLFREKFYDSIAEYKGTDFDTKPDAYTSVMWRNDALGNVENYLTTDNEGKKILMIQDSFGYFLSTYLALDIPRIDLINLNRFTGSIKSYIEETKPDVVVVLYCEKSITAIDDESYIGHKHFFDYR